MSTQQWTIDEGESGNITSTLQNKAGNNLTKSEIISLTITIIDARSNSIVNNRLNVNILDANDGTVSVEGELTFKLQPEDTINVGSPKNYLEEKQITIQWTWLDLEGDLNTGKHVFSIYVKTYTDNTSASSIVAPSIPSGSQFTSLPEIQRVFSVEGVDNHNEDSLGDSTVIDEIIYRATETVLQFLRGRFSESDMKDSYWVRMKATYIACYYLSIRQGNPALYGDMYNEAMLDLAQARDGLINTGLRTTPRMVVQTPMLDSRFYNPARILPNRSTKVYSGQRLPYRLGVYE